MLLQIYTIQKQWFRSASKVIIILYSSSIVHPLQYHAYILLLRSLYNSFYLFILLNEYHIPLIYFYFKELILNAYIFFFICCRMEIASFGSFIKSLLIVCPATGLESQLAVAETILISPMVTLQ